MVHCAGLPAKISIIPPVMDSIILDYQSPNAPPGFYPNELNLTGPEGGIGEAPATSALWDSLNASIQICFAFRRLNFDCLMLTTRSGLQVLSTSASTLVQAPPHHKQPSSPCLLASAWLLALLPCTACCWRIPNLAYALHSCCRHLGRQVVQLQL